MASNNMSDKLKSASQKYNKHNLVKLVVKAAKNFGIPANIAISLVEQESGFNPSARSKVGAIGLTQLMPATAKMLGVRNPFNAVENINGGMKYLRQQFDKFKSWDLALAAYNAGPGNVQKAGNKVPNIPETKNYVRSIINKADKFTRDLAKNPQKMFQLYGDIYSILDPIGGRMIKGGINGALNIADGISGKKTTNKSTPKNNQTNMSTQQSQPEQYIDDYTDFYTPQLKMQQMQPMNVGNMQISQNADGAYQINGSPTGVDATKAIDEGLKTIPTMQQSMDVITKNVIPQITGQLDKYGDVLLANTPTKEEVQSMITQNRDDAQALINQAPNMMNYLDRADKARQEAMEAMANDPRLQNQGYYINPRALLGAYMQSEGTSPKDLMDYRNALYKAEMSNKLGIPYDDYVTALEAKNKALADSLTTYNPLVGTLGASQANVYATKGNILGNNQTAGINAYNSLNTGNQNVGAYGVGSANAVGAPYTASIPSAITAQTTKGTTGVDVGLKDVGIQADTTRALMSGGNGQATKQPSLIDMLNAKSEFYKNMGQAKYYNSMGNWLDASNPMNNPYALQTGQNALFNFGG